MVFFGEADGRLVVVEEKDFEDRYPVTIEVNDPNDPLVRGVQSGRPYWYWISGVAAEPGARTVAEFEFHVKGPAADSLRAQGFPLRTPALVRRDARPLGAYLAGDFSDIGAGLPPIRQTRFVDWWRRWVTRRRDTAGSMRDTFWHVAAPIWDNMIDEATAFRGR
jgi:hypothetical protein